MSIEITIDHAGDGSIATVTVEQGGTSTRHRVTVTTDDLRRYGAADVEDLVRRSFAFLLDREPNTSIMREFRITEIERYFPDFPSTIGSS